MSSNERLWQRAQRYIESDQITAARITLEALVQQAPLQASARMLLASAILKEGGVREAARHAVAAAQSMPDDGHVIATIAQCLIRIGEMVAARSCLQLPSIASIRDGRVLMALAHAQQGLGDHVAALRLMDQARATGFDNPDFRYFRSLQLQFNGRLKEAEAELDACLRSGPTYGRASLTLARMRKQTVTSNHLDYIRSQLKRVEHGSEDHASFEFALYKELEDLGDVDAAFDALQRANAVMYGRLGHDVEREHAMFDRLKRMFAAPAPALHAGEFAGPMPIFVVGLPRSGTTMLDRVLDNHSMVTSTGERSDFPKQLRWTADTHGHELLDEPLLARCDDLDYRLLGKRYLQQTQWRAQGYRYFVDKLPPNYTMLGFIRRALPEAKILHMVRDPMDVCFSNYKAMFGDAYGYSYDVRALGAHYAEYRSLMDHWHGVMPGQILDVNYAEFVADPEAMAERIFAYCDLPHESGCADTRRNRSAVDTLSSAQVREPIHSRALGEWRRYESRLAQLQQALAR